MKLDDLLPPILSRFARKINLLRRDVQVFDSHLAASKACTEFGYEAQDLVEVVYRKTLLYRESLQQAPLPLSQSDALVLFALGLLHRDGASITVLDFGGACGAHYFRIRALIRTTLKLRWAVVETPSMVRKAHLLQSDSLSFFDSLSEASKALGKIDIVFSSGTLQCVPDPFMALADLIALRSEYVVLTRLGLSEEPNDIITLHSAKLSDNGPGPMPEGLRDGTTRYPFIFPNRSQFESYFEPDYEVVAISSDDSGIFPVGNKRLVGLGYVLKRRG